MLDRGGRGAPPIAQSAGLPTVMPLPVRALFARDRAKSRIAAPWLEPFAALRASSRHWLPISPAAATPCCFFPAFVSADKRCTPQHEPLEDRTITDRARLRRSPGRTPLGVAEQVFCALGRLRLASFAGDCHVHASDFENLSPYGRAIKTNVPHGLGRAQSPLAYLAPHCVTIISRDFKSRQLTVTQRRGMTGEAIGSP